MTYRVFAIFIIFCDLWYFPTACDLFCFKIIDSVQFSHVQLFVTLWITTLQASLSITNSWSLPKLMCIESVMPSNPLILSRPLLLLSSIFPNIRVFSTESALHIRWPKYWSFSFNISPSNEHFQIFKLVLEKAEELEIKLPTFAGSSKKQESSRKTSISALLTMPSPLSVWITINCGKFWKRWEYQNT